MSKNKRRNIIKKISIAIASLAMIVCFIILFVAASKDRSKATCKAVDITMNADNNPVFFDKKNILLAITGDKKMNPIGKHLNNLNIQQIEQSVKSHPWVKDAELYMDNHNILKINITQRTPVARLFTSDGNSFYIDNELKSLPVTGSFTIKLPVFTDLKYNPASLSKQDSVLFGQIISLSNYLNGHPFWMAQIDQINVNNNQSFEMIPTVGSALIEFGNGDHIDEKFNKLLSFYKNGLNNIGWGYYDTVSLQFEGQVVATRKNNKGVPVIDSLLAQDGYNLPENKLK